MESSTLTPSTQRRISTYILDAIEQAKAEAEQGNTGIVPPYILDAIEALHVDCSNEEGDVSFSSKDGTLIFGDRVVDLECEIGEHTAKYPDASVTLWSCVEARAGEGRFRVEVSTLGIIPVTLANVSIEQMFPLPPKKLENLLCK